LRRLICPPCSTSNTGVWCAAVGKSKTLTFSDALGQTQSVSGGPEGESVSPAEPNEPSLETGNATRKPIALFLSTLRETVEQFAQKIFKALTKPGLFMEPKTPEEQILL